MQSRQPPPTKFIRPSVSLATAKLPHHKAVGFKFPVVSNPKVVEAFDTRKVNLISGKEFKNVFKGHRKEDQFIGTLRIF